jgi:Predicted permease
VPPFLVFLTAIAGGELFGIGGIVFATPALAVMRVLFDFLQARIRVEDDGPSTRVVAAETVRQPTKNPSMNDLHPRRS